MHALQKTASVGYVSTDDQKKQASQWFAQLQKMICSEFERLESLYATTECSANTGSTASRPGKFEFTPWERASGGGGIMGVMRGNVFEKVGVNISTVFGEFSPEFRKEINGAEEDPRFWATGVSLVAHMHSPLVPSVHMNTRHIVTTKGWFGGGADLTPTFPFDDDTRDFHGVFKKTCDRHDPIYYPRFKSWCDEYFYIPHRKEPRGVGGIFYDYLNSGSWEKDFAFTQDVGKAFIEAYCPLVERRMYLAWNEEQKHAQLRKRGRYLEFNLLYDRGTRFGLMTEGNVDAILMSMPPAAEW